MSAPAAVVDRVHRVMSDAGLDLLLLNAPANVWYVSGYPLALSGLQRRGYARNAVVIVPIGGPPILVVGAFEEQISRVGSWLSDIETFDDYLVPPVVGAAEVVKRRRLPRKFVGIEYDHLSERFSRLLRDALPEASIISADRLCETVRMSKDPHEIAGMEAAYQAASLAAAQVLQETTAGLSESDVRNRIMAVLVRTLWSERVDGSVLSGPRIVARNGQASERKLAPGDWVRLDYTFMHGSHAGRLSRMGAVGNPSGDQRERFRAYASACIEGIGQLRSGQTGAEVHERFRAEFARHAVGEVIGGAGSGIGYGPVEPPYLVPGETRRLISGAILSIEPMTADGLCANWMVHVQESGVRMLDCAFLSDALFVIDRD
jgi:Xaa-Pro dipeptidase